MKRNTDYTSDAVRDSIQETMSRVKEYFDENWAEGKEYVVLKHIQDILGQEIDKYLPQGAARDIYFHFASIDGSKKRYEEYYAKKLEKYGPYVMELLAEYGHSLALSGRYDVGDRESQVRDEIQKNLMKEFLSDESVNEMLDKATEDIDKFMKKHGITKYSITGGKIGVAIDVDDDITLTKEDAPRGLLKQQAHFSVGRSESCRRQLHLDRKRGTGQLYGNQETH